ALCARADAELTIPIAPEVDSLGVAAATAILLHALTSPRAPPASGI
nr:RNA methyltransferase [Nannocystis sp.]